MFNKYEHPAVSRAQEIGYGERYEERELICPACGEILQPDETIYKQDGEVVGCKYCISEAEAGEEL